MALISTNSRVVLVEIEHGCTKSEHFKSRLDMVLEIMDNGAIGDGRCYGDGLHKAALTRIEERVREVRENIKRDEEEPVQQGE